MLSRGWLMHSNPHAAPCCRHNAAELQRYKELVGRLERGVKERKEQAK